MGNCLAVITCLIRPSNFDIYVQVQHKDLAGSFTLLVFADPAKYKNALENIRRLQEIIELSGVSHPRRNCLPQPSVSNVRMCLTHSPAPLLSYFQ